MCDKAKVWLAYGMIVAPLIAAIAIAGTAMATNASWWATWAAPGLMLASIGSAALALAAIINFRTILDNYYACMRATGSRPCTGLSTGTISLQIIAAITAFASLMILGYNAAAWAWFPGAGLIPMGVYLVALAALVALVVAMAPTLGGLIGCLETPLITTPSPPTNSGNLAYKVVTCPLNSATCNEDKMVDAIKTSINMEWQVAPSSAVLFRENGTSSIATVKAVITDAYNNQVSLPPLYIKDPNTHQVNKEPGYHAVILDWTYLSNNGLRLERSHRKWQLDLTVDFSNGQHQRITFNLRIVM